MDLSAIELQHEHSRDAYRRLAQEIRRLLDEDPDFPRRGLALARSRYKRFPRLAEKLGDLEASGVEIDGNNYADYVVDLLGIRYITLRPGDRHDVCEFIRAALADGRLIKVRDRVVVSFGQLPFDADYDNETTELVAHEGGYTSVHFVVELPAEVAERRGLTGLRAEIQVRTLLEEAWSEVDHRYRYEVERAGGRLPDYLSNAFTDLSHLLLSAARIQESLCSAADRYLGELTDGEGAGRAGSPPDDLNAPVSVTEQREMRHVIDQRLSIALSPEAVRLFERLMLREFGSASSDDFTRLLDLHLVGFKAVCAANGLKGVLDGRGGDDLRELEIFATYASALEHGSPDAETRVRLAIEKYLS